jgi:hypothetical protein
MSAGNSASSASTVWFNVSNPALELRDILAPEFPPHSDPAPSS